MKNLVVRKSESKLKLHESNVSPAINTEEPKKLTETTSRN